MGGKPFKIIHIIHIIIGQAKLLEYIDVRQINFVLNYSSVSMKIDVIDKVTAASKCSLH